MTRFKWGHWPDPFTLCRCNYPTCSVERMCFVVWRAFCWNCFLGNDDFSKPLYPKLRRPYTPNLCSALNSNHSFKQSTWWSGHGNLPMSSWQCGLADLATWSSVDLRTWERELGKVELTNRRCGLGNVELTSRRCGLGNMELTIQQCELCNSAKQTDIVILE